MDAKTEYSSSVEQQKIASLSDEELANAISAGAARKRKYGHEWQEADINDVFQKFGILASTKEYRNGKIIFYDETRSIAIVTDVGGGYFRIEDKTVSARRPHYLDINGNDPHEVMINGKMHTRTHDELMSATHFIIKKKETK